MYPTFLIAGPPRSGSTSLHFYLGQHPEIYTSKIKETDFFTKHYSKGGKFYERYFKDAGNVVAIGEATPTYSFLPFAADRIQKTLPNVKLIFCFRNPIERAYSHWQILYNEGIEKVAFSEAITINKAQFANILFEGEQGAKEWNKSARHEKKEKNWVRPYIHPGMYAQSLKIYFQRFEKNNIHVLFLEDLKDDFNNAMMKLFEFLGVNKNFIIPDKQVQNSSTSSKAYRNISKLFGSKASKILAKLLPKKIKIIIKPAKRYESKMTMKEEDRLLLWQLYEADINELSAITGRDLLHWRPQ